MTFASSNLAVLRCVAETVMGTTPTSPTLQNLRFVSESLNYNLENIESEEIRADRGVSDLIQVRSDAAGDINVEMSFATFDDFLTALMCQTDWTVVDPKNKTLVNGIVTKSFTVQKHFTDVAQIFNFTGAIINTFRMNAAIGQTVQGAFGLMALGAARTATQFAGATINAANTNRVFNCVSNVGSLVIDSVPYTGCISALSLEVNNNYRPVDCIGQLAHKDLLQGTFGVNGSMDLYFQDGTLYDKFLSSTSLGLEFVLDDDAGSQYKFEMDSLKFQTGEVVAGGRNTDVMFRASYQALHNQAMGGTLRITRTIP